jgi:hypothetical protein
MSSGTGEGGMFCYSISLSGIVWVRAVAVLVVFLVEVIDAVAAGWFFLCVYL